MISINTNYGSLFASKSAGAAQKTMNMAMERLSSGLRVNSAADDAAGRARAALGGAAAKAGASWSGEQDRLKAATQAAAERATAAGSSMQAAAASYSSKGAARERPGRGQEEHTSLTNHFGEGPRIEQITPYHEAGDGQEWGNMIGEQWNLAPSPGSMFLTRLITVSFLLRLNLVC